MTLIALAALLALQVLRRLIVLSLSCCTADTKLASATFEPSALRCVGR